MSSVTLLSPAKINLTLEILGARPDGYHEINSIIQPIDLFDEASIEILDGEGIEIDATGFTIPLDQNNLAYKAAELYLKQIGRKIKTKIRINKQIPLGAGLGGGSSNAASVLIGLNRTTKALTEDDLLTIAAKIGADVPFFIRSQTSIIQGVGERLTPLRDFPTFHYVIICPNVHSSTKDVYKKWDELNPNYSSIRECHQSNFEETLEKFRDRKQIPPLRNDLEDAAFALHPEIKSFKEILKSLGLESVLMTGSGSAVFALFRNKEEAEDIYEYLKTSPTFKVFLASGIKGWHRLV